jgi:hypothetical protein
MAGEPVILIGRTDRKLRRIQHVRYIGTAGRELVREAVGDVIEGRRPGW